MKIAIAADHAGYELKTHLARWLTTHGFEVVDLGTDSTASVDYPHFAQQVAQRVTAGEAERGVLVCGSGIGMAMAANRFDGARAAVLRIASDAVLSREHNNANIACFGGRVTPATDAVALLEQWLATDFAGGRHERRVQQLDATPRKSCP